MSEALIGFLSGILLFCGGYQWRRLIVEWKGQKYKKTDPFKTAERDEAR